MKLEVNTPGVVLGGQVCRVGREMDLDDKYLGQLIRLKNRNDLKIEILESPKGLATLNYRPDNFDPRDFPMLLSQAVVTPDVVDYTGEMSSVKEQKELGSCVSFAVTAVKEWQERKEYLQEKLDGKKYDRLVEHDLSEQWLYYKCKEIDPWPNEEGSSLRYAMKVLQKQGIPPEKGWKYNDKIKGEHERWAPLMARWGYGGTYFRISSVAALEASLFKNGPVAIGVMCFQEIFNPGPSGVVRMPRNEWLYYGNHAITCVGFNRRTRLFKFKNSWGVGYGQRGYGYFPYDYIKNYMIDAWVIEDVNVSREMFLRGSNIIQEDVDED